MASVTLSLKVNKWVRSVNAIVRGYGKMEKMYVRAFDSIIYYLEVSSTPFPLDEYLKTLNEYLDGSVQSDFTTALRDFCKISESALPDNYSDFRSELMNMNFWNSLYRTYGYVSSLKKETEEKLLKEKAEAEERRRKEKAAEEERKRKERAAAEERMRLQREEEEKRRKAAEAEEAKRRKAAEAEEAKRREEIEKAVRRERELKAAIELGEREQARNPQKIRMILMGLLAGLISIGVTYLLFLSPVSVIAKWNDLSVTACGLYILGGLFAVFSSVAIMNIVLSGVVLIQLPVLLAFWFTYSIIRTIPLLDGWLSWTILIILVILEIPLVLLFNVAVDEFALYRHYYGHAYSSRNKQKSKSAIMISTGVILLLSSTLFIALKNDYAYKTFSYHVTEYRMLMDKAERCVAEEDYITAIECLKEARNRKTREKKIWKINGKISEVQSALNKEISGLKAEVRSILDVFRKYSLKYGVPVNDISKTQEKLDQLKKLAPSDNEVVQLQRQLDYYKKK